MAAAQPCGTGFEGGGGWGRVEDIVVIAPSLARHGLRLLCFVAFAAGAAPPARAQQRESAKAEPPARPEVPCECQPKLVGKCFTVRGSVAVYRTAPTVRIAIAGSKRVLGLKDGLPEFLEEDLEVRDNQVIGEFVVCPFTRPKPGAIQLVCIASAHDMVVKAKR